MARINVNETDRAQQENQEYEANKDTVKNLVFEFIQSNGKDVHYRDLMVANKLRVLMPGSIAKALAALVNEGKIKVVGGSQGNGSRDYSYRAIIK